MEPNLNDMDDYKKPLSKEKKRVIIFFFAIIIVMYAVYAIFLSNL